MKIHHIAYAVKSIERSRPGFEALGYEVVQRTVEDKDRGIYICFMEHMESGTLIELIEPASEDNPVKNYLKKMKNVATPYHICYETADLDEAIKIQMEAGFIVTAAPAPAPAINGRRVAFMAHPAVGLIEFVEMPNISK